MRILASWFVVISTVAASVTRGRPPFRCRVRLGRTGAHFIVNPQQHSPTWTPLISASSFRGRDDSVYALPLIVARSRLSGKRHNVVFVASNGKYRYALTADDAGAVGTSLVAQSWPLPLPSTLYLSLVAHCMSRASPFVSLSFLLALDFVACLARQRLQPVRKCARQSTTEVR